MLLPNLPTYMNITINEPETLNLTQNNKSIPTFSIHFGKTTHTNDNHVIINNISKPGAKV